MNITELRNARARAIESARAIYTNAQTANRAPNDDEARQFDAFMAEADTHKTSIERMERLETEERALEASQGRRTTDARIRTATDAELRSYLTGETNLNQGYSFEVRAQTVGTAASGGYTVADEPMGAFEKALKAFGGMRQASKILRTSTGADLPYPLMNDTANVASIIGENTALGSGPDMTFTNLTMKAHKYSSGIVLLPWELLTDSNVNIGQIIGEALGERIGRAQNAHFTNGTGTAQPLGVTTDATVAVTGTSLAAGVTYANLIDLIHSVDAAYRANAVFMLSDTTLAALRKILDDNGRPLFWSDANSLASGVEGTLLGYRYVINNDMPSLATADANSILFGDFQRGYLIRDVTTIKILRLNERYADTGQVGFVGHARSDGRLLDAGTHPIKAFANAAA